MLEDLKETLGPESIPFIKHLECIKDLHTECVGESLVQYNEVIHDFKSSFDKMYRKFNMNMILKTHIIYHHLEDYFDWTETTLKYLNGEFVETAHSTLRKHEEAHGFKVSINKGSNIHIAKALKSHIWYNVKRAGFTPSSKFRLRARRFSNSSSPSSLPRKEYNHSKKIMTMMLNNEI